MLKAFIKASDCAQCRFCCVFSPDDCWESPFIPDEEAQKLAARGVPMENRRSGGWSFRLQFGKDDLASCPMLNPNTGCTLPSSEKPFECSIWPLRLMKERETLLIGRHQECPALTSEVTERLDHFVTGEFLPVLTQFAEKYPESLRPFAQEYHIIWQGPLKRS